MSFLRDNLIWIIYSFVCSFQSLKSFGHYVCLVSQQWAENEVIITIVSVLFSLVDYASFHLLRFEKLEIVAKFTAVVLGNLNSRCNVKQCYDRTNFDDPSSPFLSLHHRFNNYALLFRDRKFISSYSIGEQYMNHCIICKCMWHMYSVLAATLAFSRLIYWALEVVMPSEFSTTLTKVKVFFSVRFEADLKTGVRDGSLRVAPVCMYSSPIMTAKSWTNLFHNYLGLSCQ